VIDATGDGVADHYIGVKGITSMKADYFRPVNAKPTRRCRIRARSSCGFVEEWSGLVEAAGDFHLSALPIGSRFNSARYAIAGTVFGRTVHPRHSQPRQPVFPARLMP
jgi:hypothetical protein